GTHGHPAAQPAAARLARRIRDSGRGTGHDGQRGAGGPADCRDAARSWSWRAQMISRPTTVRVAGGQGFWGDWLEAPYRQVTGGPVDYLMMDYLAEVTMSILQKQKSRDPARGYASDFITQMERILPTVLERGIKVTANAWARIPAGADPGHIIECAAQCSRGNGRHDWKRNPDMANVDYPVAEARGDGNFDIVKHPRTRGRIDVASVNEQLVYEMGDPN